VGLRVMNKEILPPDEAQRLGLEFIRSKYFQAMVTISETKLVTEGAFPVYHLEGSIKIPSRSIMGRLIFREAPYTFKVQVHALEGSILNYELR